MPVQVRLRGIDAALREVNRVTRGKRNPGRRLRNALQGFVRAFIRGVPVRTGMLRRSTRLQITMRGRFLIVRLTTRYAAWLNYRRNIRRGYFRRALRQAIRRATGLGLQLTLVSMKGLRNGNMEARLRIA